MNAATNERIGGWYGWLGFCGWIILPAVIIGAWWLGFLSHRMGETEYEFGIGIHRMAGSVDLHWETRYAGDQIGPSTSLMNDAVFSSDGRLVYVTGWSILGKKKTHPVTLAYDVTTGSRVWKSRHGRFHDKFTKGKELAACPATNRIYVVGWGMRWKWQRAERFYFDKVARNTWFLSAHDGRTGKLLWAAEDSANIEGFHQPRALVVSPCGSRVFVLLRIEKEGRVAAVLTAYEVGAGDLLWSSELMRVGPNGNFSGARMKVSSDGRKIYVVGGTNTGRVGLQWTALGINARTGSREWAATGGLGDRINVSGISLCASGDLVFLAGSPDYLSESHSDCRPWTRLALHAASGDVLWEMQGDAAGADATIVVRGIAAGIDGEIVYTAGTRVTIGGDRSLVLLAYKATTGGLLWEKEWADKKGIPVEAIAIAVAPDGRSIVTSAERQAGPMAFVTIGWDSQTGAPLWLAESGDTDSRRGGPKALAISPDSKRVLVTGRSQPQGKGFIYSSTYVYEIDPSGVETAVTFKYQKDDNFPGYPGRNVHAMPGRWGP